MLTFALAAGPAISDRVLDALGDPSPTGLPYRPTRHLWSNPSGTVTFAAWQDDIHLGMGSRWSVTDEGVTAFAGHLWPRSGVWTGRRPWAEQLREYLRQRSPSQWADDLLGIFTAISLDAGGVGTVSSDALGTSLIYRADADGTTVVSTNVALAAHLVNAGTPARDVLGVGWLAYCGYVMGHRSGYAGVDVVPFGVQAAVSPSGISLQEVAPLWRAIPEGDPGTLLDEVYAGMVTSIRGALSFPVERRVAELTGGKDSRLILALLLAEGLSGQFEFRTFGGDTLPDVMIARQLAVEFGLRHETGPDGERRQRARDRQERLAAAHPGTSMRELQLRADVGAWAGMRNAWQIEGAAPPRGDRVTLNGLYGESLATNFATTTRLRNHAEVRQLLLVDMKFGAARLLQPDVLEMYRHEQMALAYHAFSFEAAPQDIIDGMFLRQRMRRWFGMTQEADELTHVYPLHSQLAVRLAFSIGARDRHAGWLHQRLFERAWPSLARKPFARGGWPETFVPDRSPEPTRVPDLRPVEGDRPTAPSRVALTDERQRHESTDVDIMRRFLVDDRSNPIYSVLDHAAVRRAVEGFEQLTEPQTQQVYGALTAAIWLGGHEIGTDDVAVG